MDEVPVSGRGLTGDAITAGFRTAFQRLGPLKAALLLALAIGLVGEQVVLALNNTGSAGRTNLHPSRTVSGQLDALIRGALGPSDRGVRRFRVERLTPAPGHPGYRAVTVIWTINNDLSAGTIGNGAQVDVYTLFSSLFESHLRLWRVSLIGTYPVTGRDGRVRERPVIRVSLDAPTARAIAAGGWSNLDALSLWPLVHREYVNPDFQPTPTE